MKKFLLSFVIFFLAFSTVFGSDSSGRVSFTDHFVQVANAQNPPIPPSPTPTTRPTNPRQVDDAYTTCIGSAGGNATAQSACDAQRNADRNYVACYLSSPQTPGAAAACENQAARNQAPNAPSPYQAAPQSSLPYSERCSYWNIECGLRNLVMWISLAILFFFAWLLIVISSLFNEAVILFVAGFSDLILNKGFGGPINELWKLVRDLVNITFVFALVWIGITTIVNGSSNTKKMLSSIIVSALLVNFSLFFAKAIIDISNLTADTIYKSIVATPAGGQSVQNEQTGIAGTFIARLGLTGLFVGSRNAQSQATRDMLQRWTNDSWVSLPSVIIYCLGVSVIFFKLTFAFGFAAFMLLLRFVVLIIVMITAPLAFLPEFLPGMGGLRQRWWHTLLSQAFVAPVFLFGIYVTLRVLSFVRVGDSQMQALFTTGGTPAVAAFTYFAVAVIMIIATTSMAKSMGSAGAEAVAGAASWVDKKLKVGLNAAVTKPSGYVAKNAAGFTSRHAARLDQNLKGSKWGRVFRTSVSIASLGTLDERARGKLYEQGQNAKFGNARSYQENRDHKAKDKKEETQREKEEAGLAELASKGATPFDETMHNDIVELIKAMRKLTQEQLEQKSMRELTNPNLAMHLTAQQMEYIKNSKKFTEADKEKIRLARENGMVEAARGGDASLVRHERNATEMTTLPTAALTHPSIALNLTASQRDKIRDDTTRSIADRDRIFTAQQSQLTMIANNVAFDPVSFRDFMTHRDRTANEIAQLPASFLQHPEVAPYLTPGVLQAIFRQNNLRDPADLTAIRDNILNHGGPARSVAMLGAGAVNTPLGAFFNP